MDDSTLASLRAAGAMIGESNLASWDELLTVAGGDSELRFAIAKARREFEARQVTATQCAKAMRHKLACHEPERKRGEPLVPRAASEPSRPPIGNRKSTPYAPVTSAVDESEHEPTDVVHKHGGETADVDEAELVHAEQQQADVLEADGELGEAAAPSTTTKEPTMPKGIPCDVDFRALAKQLGTFRTNDIARKAKVRSQVAQSAMRKLEADGFIEREPPGHRKCPWRVVGAPGARAAPAGDAKPARGRRSAPEGAVKADAARQEPEPRPLATVPSATIELIPEGRFDELLGRLLDAYTERHDIAIKPSARRALLQAAAAVFPAE